MSLRDDIETAIKATEGRSGKSCLTNLEFFASCLAGTIGADHPDLADRIRALSNEETTS